MSGFLGGKKHVVLLMSVAAVDVFLVGSLTSRYLLSTEHLEEVRIR
jgi:hypothetical protein